MKISFCTFKTSFAQKAFILAMITLVSLQSKAEGWGDLGYGDESESDTAVSVEPISDELAKTEGAPETLTEWIDPAEALPAKPVSNRSEASFSSPTSRATAKSSNLNTVQNTYGVLTVADPGVQFFAAPFVGVATVAGLDSIDVTPKMTTGMGIGFQLSGQVLLQASFKSFSVGTSQPLLNTGFSSSSTTTTVYDYSGQTGSLGARLFFLGREKRLRPFFGGGMAYTSSQLKYDSSVNLFSYGPSIGATYQIKQWSGFGELGTEIGLNKNWVVLVSGRLDGVLSQTSSADDTANLSQFDLNQQEVGRQLTRATALSMTVGLGLYF